MKRVLKKKIKNWCSCDKSIKAYTHWIGNIEKAYLKRRWLPRFGVEKVLIVWNFIIVFRETETERQRRKEGIVEIQMGPVWNLLPELISGIKTFIKTICSSRCFKRLDARTRASWNWHPNWDKRILHTNYLKSTKYSWQQINRIILFVEKQGPILKKEKLRNLLNFFLTIYWFLIS